MNRRTFCLSAAAAAVAASRARALSALAAKDPANGPLITLSEIESIDRERILRAANEYLPEPPITVTASSSPRSKGGKHDYFSEGGLLVARPEESRRAVHRARRLLRSAELQRASRGADPAEPDCAGADGGVAHHAGEALRGARGGASARVVPRSRETRMNPSLDYAQAIRGASPGRGTGIIDTLHLVEVTRAARHLETAQAMTPAESAGVRDWFYGISVVDASLKERPGGRGRRRTITAPAGWRRWRRSRPSRAMRMR